MIERMDHPKVVEELRLAEECYVTSVKSKVKSMISVGSDYDPFIKFADQLKHLAEVEFYPSAFSGLNN